MLLWLAEASGVPSKTLLVASRAAFGVRPESALDSYTSDLFERFWDYGLDYAARHCLADYLVNHTWITPAFGWARKRKDDPRIARELAMALTEAIERAVALALWAGADSHLKVPGLMWPQPDEEHEGQFLSAIEEAVSEVKGKNLARLGPDPSREAFDELWSKVLDPVAVDVLGPRNCDPATLAELTRTSAVRTKLVAYGII